MTDRLPLSGGATARVYEARDQKPGTRDHCRVALKVRTPRLAAISLSSGQSWCILHACAGLSPC